MTTVDDILAHHGIKGMRWGVRRSEKQLHSGKGTNVSEDHANAAAAKAKVKKHGVKSLSNKELQDVINRMNLEQSYARSKEAESSKGRFKKGHETVKTILDVGSTGLKIHGMITNPATKAGARIVFGAAKKAARK